MTGRGIGAIDQEHFEPSEADVKGNRSQAAHAAGKDRERQHALRLVGQPAHQPRHEA